MEESLQLALLSLVPMIDTSNFDLKKIRSILKKHYTLLARKPKLTPELLLASLNKEKLPSLELNFNKTRGGIDRARFVEVVVPVVEVEGHDLLDMVVGLLQLFDDIDINGDGNLEWSEFSQYVVDLASENLLQCRRPSTSQPYESRPARRKGNPGACGGWQGQGVSADGQLCLEDALQHHQNDKGGAKRHFFLQFGR